MEGWNLIFTCVLSQGTEIPPGQPLSNVNMHRSPLEGLSVPEPGLHQDLGAAGAGTTRCSRRYTEGYLCIDGVDRGKDRREEERGPEAPRAQAAVAFLVPTYSSPWPSRSGGRTSCQHLGLSCSSLFQRSDSAEAAHAGYTGFTPTAHEGAYFMS